MNEPQDTGRSHRVVPTAAFHPRRLTPARNKFCTIRTGAIESLLTDKGLVTADRLDAVINAYEHDIGPLKGAQVVARAWVDPAYKARLLQDGTAAIAELGFGGLQGERLVVVENTPRVHNVIVCALCSCYPWPILGLPPFWYKSPSYRSRVIATPREVLHEFGVDLDCGVEVRVWNSSAETRYFVLPERPPGTEHMHVEELAALVTREAMIGVARVQREKQATATFAHRQIADMEGIASLPRQSGELVFQDPWEGEVFAMAVALCEQGLYPWDEFRDHLISELAAAEQKATPQEQWPSYYECWLAAFESLLVRKGILTAKKIEARAGWIARSASRFASRSLFHLRRSLPEEEE